MDADKIAYDWRSRLARREQVLSLNRLGIEVFICDWCNTLTPTGSLIRVHCDRGSGFCAGENCSLMCAIEYTVAEAYITSVVWFFGDGFFLGEARTTKKGHFLPHLTDHGDHIWIKERVQQLRESGELA